MRHIIGILCALMLSAVSLAAEPVDTSALGWIRPGMPAAEVVSRLGDPDSRQELAPLLVGTVHRGHAALQPKVREVWTYKGDSTVRDAVILLEDGRVVQAARGK